MMRKKSVTFFHVLKTLLESSSQIFREVIVQKLMPERMEHIRDPRKCRHPIIERKRARKEFDVHRLRISKEDRAFYSDLLALLHMNTKTPLDSYYSQKSFPATQTEERLRERKGGHHSVFGSELFIPDPDPTSEQFQIRSRSYLAQYGISNTKCCTKSCLFNV
jgi:hypothetical protein